MESLIYVYMFMLLTDKEYVKYTNNTLETQKSASKISEILLKNSVSLKLVNILMYLRKLNFSQMPNYDYIKKLCA